jgi:type IV pilus assembly protein PilP
MIIKKQGYKFLFLSPLSWLICACSADNTDLKKYVDAVVHPSVRPVKLASNSGCRSECALPKLDLGFNPFQGSPKKSKKQSLAGFPLDALKFVGTLRKGEKIWALIKQPDGIVVRVGVGESMGTQEGHILFIQDHWIQLEEIIEHVNQKLRQRTTLNLDVGD